jgi:hypothetical protein
MLAIYAHAFCAHKNLCLFVLQEVHTFCHLKIRISILVYHNWHNGFIFLNFLYDLDCIVLVLEFFAFSLPWARMQP